MTANLYQGLLADFVFDATERLDRIEQSLIRLPEASVGERANLLEVSRRELHTLKGNAGMMGFKELQELAHHLETEFEILDENPSQVADLLTGVDNYRNQMNALTKESDSEEVEGKSLKSAEAQVSEGSVRVPFSALNNLVDLLAEMVVYQNQLRDSIGRGPEAEVPEQAWIDVSMAEEALGKTLSMVQESILHLRLVPLGNLFGQLGRIVHDESDATGKRVQFETAGGDTPVDKALLEIANEALGHLVRNAVIHGIEAPKERVSLGKPAEGKISVVASRQGNEVKIEVTDDGAGVDREALLDAAATKGVEADDDNLDLLMFVPGLSTRAAADMSSGRGVGLSAVVDSIRRMNGRVEVRSIPGQGCQFRIHLPLSVSIIRTLMLRADGEEYALPISSIEESRHFYSEEGHQINTAGVISWRDNVIPLIDLGYAFKTSAEPRSKGAMIIVNAGGKNRGVIADEVIGIRDVIVKGLDDILGPPDGVFGSTILGDGRVVLILDPQGLVELPTFVGDLA